jgi:hypothetical protein
MEIKGEDFLVTFNEPKASVEFFGTIRLRDSLDYKAINDLLETACQRVTGDLIMDFRNLQFLNSAGINTVSKFVISARGGARCLLKVLGNKQIAWQAKSLRNLQKLWPKVTIEIS